MFFFDVFRVEQSAIIKEDGEFEQTISSFRSCMIDLDLIFLLPDFKGSFQIVRM